MAEPIRFELSEDAVSRIAALAAEIVLDRLDVSTPEPSPYLTIRETAELLRCPRQRVDDLLSQGRLTWIKEGRRTLIARAELKAYVSSARDTRVR